MLSLSFHRRYLPITALLTVSAWMLALLAGAVNACLLQPELGHAYTSAESTRSTLTESALRGSYVDHGDHGLRAGQTDNTTDAGQASCLKFCDDESSTVAKGKSAQASLSGFALASRTNWYTVAPATAVANRGAVERLFSHGPPLVIRFLRLTI
jgi:hypothetical protein